MLRQRLVASLLLDDGRLVKGTQFTNYRDAGLPETTARAHNAQGIDEILLLDIGASRYGREPDIDTLAKVAADCMTPVTFGGGICGLEIADAAMRHGADKLLLTTTAYENPKLITALARVFGSQAVVAGLDVVAAPGGWALYNHVSGGVMSDVDPLDWAESAVGAGAGEVRLMAVDREGTRKGFDLDLLRTAATRLTVPVLIEGGAGRLDDIDAAFVAGAHGVCLGSMLVFADNNIVKIKRFLEGRGRNIRTGS